MSPLLCCPGAVRFFQTLPYSGYWELFQIGYGVTVNIAASHAAARGSIPRIRITFLF